LADTPIHVRGAPSLPPPEITTVRRHIPKLGQHIFIPLHCRKNQLDLAQDHLCGEENAPNTAACLPTGSAVQPDGNSPSDRPFAAQRRRAAAAAAATTTTATLPCAQRASRGRIRRADISYQPRSSKPLLLARRSLASKGDSW
jgi:hypothetical protein